MKGKKMNNHLIKINGKRVSSGRPIVKANIIWKRTNDSFGLLIDDCNGSFMATVNTFKSDGSLDTTISWPFQTFDGCLKWFERTLDDMDFDADPECSLGQGGNRFAPKPKRWPNGELRKNGES